MNAFITVHSLVAVVRTSILLSLFYSRFSKPAKKISQIMFSEKLIVTPKSGDFPVLCARLANVRKGQIVEARARMICCIGNCKFQELPLIKSQVFLAVPDVVQHQLNRRSPIYDKIKDSTTSRTNEEVFPGSKLLIEIEKSSQLFSSLPCSSPFFLPDVRSRF